MRTKTRLGVFIVVFLTAAFAFAPLATATPRPTPTVKACHICEEEDAAWATATARAMAKPAAVDLASSPELTAPTVPDPVVRAVMFWVDGCPHCHAVLDQVLPPLQAQYGGQLQIHLIEVSPEATLRRFFQVAAALGIDQNDVFVPFLMIGDQVLIGSQEIPARLPGLIGSYLAAGGVDYPDLPELQSLLPAEIATASSALPQEAAVVAATPQPTLIPVEVAVEQHATDPWSNGFALAIAVMIGMVASLIYAGIRLVRDDGGEMSRFAQVGWTVLTPLLALAGLAVAGYLTYVETQLVQAVCGPVGDCNAVQSSSYARLFGVLPVGVLGAAGYLGILAAWLLNRLGRGRLAVMAPAAVLVMTLFGVIFSIYLTYLELFVIRAVCIWCLTSAVIITLLMLLSLKPELQAFALDDEELDDESVAEPG
jgi:uncharacterized membrane protein